MQNIKQLREKYEEIKSQHQMRSSSARSLVSSSRIQYEKGVSQSKLNKFNKKQSCQQLLCCSCFNEKLVEQKQYEKKQSLIAEKNRYRELLELNLSAEKKIIDNEKMMLKNKNEIEKQNLLISHTYDKMKKEQNKKQKELEFNFEQEQIRLNQQIDQQEKEQRKKMQDMLNQDLILQITKKINQQQQQKFNNQIQQDDPYWRHQSQQEQENQQRKNYQLSYINNNWILFEQEKQKQLKLNADEKEKELKARISHLQFQQTQLLKEKNDNIRKQQILTQDLEKQVKDKKRKIQEEKQLEQVIQQKINQKDILNEQKREEQEIKNRKQLSLEISESLNKQILFQQQQIKKNLNDKQNYSQTNFMDSKINKLLVCCSNCRKQKEPQQLSQY